MSTFTMTTDVSLRWYNAVVSANCRCGSLKISFDLVAPITVFRPSDSTIRVKGFRDIHGYSESSLLVLGAIHGDLYTRTDGG